MSEATISLDSRDEAILLFGSRDTYLKEIRSALGDEAAFSEITPRQQALLRWTELVTANAAAEDDAVYASLREHFTDAEIAELTLLSCLFNGWNRFTRSFRIELEDVEGRDGITACLARPPAQP